MIKKKWFRYCVSQLLKKYQHFYYCLSRENPKKDLCHAFFWIKQPHIYLDLYKPAFCDPSVSDYEKSPPLGREGDAVERCSGRGEFKTSFYHRAWHIASGQEQGSAFFNFVKISHGHSSLLYLLLRGSLLHQESYLSGSNF